MNEHLYICIVMTVISYTYKACKYAIRNIYTYNLYNRYTHTHTHIYIYCIYEICSSIVCCGVSVIRVLCNN